jgi:hypothetical protein
MRRDVVIMYRTIVALWIPFVADCTTTTLPSPPPPRRAATAAAATVVNYYSVYRTDRSGAAIQDIMMAHYTYS